MSAELNSGKGQCKGTACLLVKPIQGVIDLGGSEDVRVKALNAVHHANRHGSMSDFIAVALPEMKMGRNCMQPGHEIVLIGSETSLTAYLNLEGPMSLKRRGMLLKTEIEETFMDHGIQGAAYVRDRSCEKRTPGWIRRSQARAARRGKPVGKSISARSNDMSALALYYGRTVLHVRQVVGNISKEPLMVSTYGFSARGVPAILPVVPRHFDDAA